MSRPGRFAEANPFLEPTGERTTVMVDVVTEFYKTWPYVEDDPSVMESPYSMDLYDCIEGGVLSVNISRGAPAIRIFEDLCDAGREARIVGLHV